MIKKILHYLKVLFDLFFPKTCASCNIRLGISESLICSECENDLNLRKINICEVCGSDKTKECCKVCESNSFAFYRALSCYSFNKITQKLIHDFKYNGNIEIGNELGRRMAEYINDNIDVKKLDYIIPVPLHRVKFRARGFNQSEVLAKSISKSLSIPYNEKIIFRSIYTKTQTKLSKQERLKNVSQAFKMKNSYLVRDKNVLIVDDVFTTGSTVNTMSHLLKSQGVDKIFVLTTARA